MRKKQIKGERDHILEKHNILYTHQINFLTKQYRNELEKIEKIHLLEKKFIENKSAIQQRNLKTIHNLQAQQYREIIFTKKKRLPKESKILLELEEAEREFTQYQKTEKSNVDQIIKNEELKLEAAHRNQLEVLRIKYDLLMIDANYKLKQDCIRTNVMCDILIYKLLHSEADSDPAIQDLYHQIDASLLELQQECETRKSDLKHSFKDEFML